MLNACALLSDCLMLKAFLQSQEMKSGIFFALCSYNALGRVDSSIVFKRVSPVDC